MDKIYEGKAKILYADSDDGVLVQFFKNSATAFNGQKHLEIPGKGAVNNAVSCFFMELLEYFGISTHHIKKVDPCSSAIKRAKVIPVEFIVRNYCAGRSFPKRSYFKHGQKLPVAISEIFLKDDALQDPLIGEDYAINLGIITAEQLAYIKRMALRINDILSSYLWAKGIILADMKLEFGMIHNLIMLVDEISMDTCRFWARTDRRTLDKDVFRFETDNPDKIIERYIEASSMIMSCRASDYL